MKIRIRYVADAGNKERERLVLRAASTTDIGDFMLVRTGFIDEDVTTEVKDSFWFPYKRVAADDLIVLYSKAGRPKEKPLDGGRTAHFFFWGRPEALWGTDDVAPVLLYAPEWASQAPDKLLASHA